MRKTYSRLIYLGAIFMFLMSCKNKVETVTKVDSNKKPNIIFILTDDQRWDALGYAGNELAHTPEMDKLAKQGVFFKNSVSTTPICSASRASIFSGLHERTHRYSFSSSSIKEEFMKKSFPRLLKESGYHTGLYGKFGVKYKSLDSLYNEYENYDLRYDRKDITSYYYKTLGKDTVHLTRYTGEKGLQFIKDASSDKPFCLQLSFSAPHASDNTKEQYFWQEENNHVLEHVTIPKPRNATKGHYDSLPQLVKDGFNKLRWFWRYDTPEKYQHSVKGYYRMIAGVDNEIGKIRNELKKKGLDSNTIIILMGDNGLFLGERQIAGKWLMYENSIKVPLVIYDPRHNEHKGIDEVALNLDIPSTILDYAGVEAPNTYHGKSLKPLVEQNDYEMKRDTILIEHIWDFKNIAASEGVRTKDWKYFRYVKDKTIEELYYLKDDPRETNNLVHNPVYKNELDNLRNKCDELIEKYQDSGFISPTEMNFNIEKELSLNWGFNNETYEQSAYQILVSSSLEKSRDNNADVWDSSKVTSTAHENIDYNGNKLKNGQVYYWKLRIWDDLNRVGPYSSPHSVSY